MAAHVCQVRGLQELPNELLMAIGELLYASERKNGFRRGGFKSTSILALSCVSKRLRITMLPFLFRKLTVRRVEAFSEFMAHYSSNGERSFLAPLVRSLSICDWRPRTSPGRLLMPATFPFANLTRFKCKEEVDESFISTLSRTTRLKSLAFIWEDAWPHSMLKSEGFSSMETLRVTIHHRSGEANKSPKSSSYSQSSTYPAITTLSLHHYRWHNPQLVDECITTCRFPNLAVLEFTGQRADAEILFQFIQEHPTLLEVNVDLVDQYSVRLEALLKLIDGTGTWTNSPSRGSRSCQITYDPAVTTLPSPPNIVPGAQVVCNAFGFTRIPKTARFAPWNTSVGSSEPRYICTGLLLQDLKLYTEEEGSNSYCKINEALSHLSVATPFVEELWLAIQARPVETTYMALMTEMIDSFLGKLGFLRKFALCWWSADDDRWEERQDRSMSLDSALPPFVFFDHDELFLEDPEMLACIRAALQLADEEEVPKTYPVLILRAWEERNRASATRLVHALATACDTLEEFDWIFSEPEPDVRLDSAIWPWKIGRDSERRPVQVVASAMRLSDNEADWGDPPHFYPLVGPKMQRASIF
ncbi:hypothetical protein BC835DRAFT_334036 [Cytidiella melzeri]|nr:hypothetical protein BC835DRAFT_334036 [Cytidiella melzeri]